MRPYDALAHVYDRWTTANPYELWARHIVDTAGARDGGRLLDLCCGTGRMTRLMHDAGFSVTGIDASRPMLDRAVDSLPLGTALLEKDLATTASEHLGIAPGTFDVCICSFDSVNYFTDESHLRTLFTHAAFALRPGGMFIFDVNSRFKLAHIFGNSHFGDDLGEFGYVWRNRYDPESRTCQFLISLYLRDGDHFLRTEETHVQRWFEERELTSAAARAGFTVRAMTDDYTNEPLTSNSTRETWVLQKEECA